MTYAELRAIRERNEKSKETARRRSLDPVERDRDALLRFIDGILLRSVPHFAGLMGAKPEPKEPNWPVLDFAPGERDRGLKLLLEAPGAIRKNR